MNDKIYLGAWIVAINKVLSKYNTEEPAFDPFEATIIAGRAGELFSAIRSLKAIDGNKFDLHRKLSKLRNSVTRRILEVAEELAYIKLDWSKDPSSTLVEKIEFAEDSKDFVFKAVTDIFERFNPSKIERTVLFLLDYTLVVPQLLDEVKAIMIANKLSAHEADYVINLVTELGLLLRTKEKEKGQNILFNPHSFENNAEEAVSILNQLSVEACEKALEIVEYVKGNPGIPIPGSYDKEILSLLIKAGIIDYSRITTLRRTQGVYFPTAPHIWGVISGALGTKLSDDLIDDAKLLLNSFRYGQFYSQRARGKIKNPLWIINALLRDGAIGVVKPATAIGSDYPLVLSRGIVNVVESRIYPGRFSMELMKVDVAESVKEVLEKGYILPEEEPRPEEELERAGQFISPKITRVETKLPEKLIECQEEIVFELRTMRKKK